jgi:hypothetical protein
MFSNGLVGVSIQTGLGLPWGNGSGNRIEVSQMCWIGRYPPTLMDSGKESKGAAVRVIRHHEMTTR